MKKTVIALIVIIIIIGGWWWLSADRAEAPTGDDATTAEQGTDIATDGSGATAAELEAELDGLDSADIDSEIEIIDTEAEQL